MIAASSAGIIEVGLFDMDKRIRAIRDALRARYPESRLKPLSPSEIAGLKACYPGFPEHLDLFFREVGCGCIGDSRFMIYPLLEPAEVYDPQTAGSLPGIRLVGDDFAGWCVGYDTNAGWQFGGIGGNGQFSRVPGCSSLVDLIERWFVQEGPA
jgi:hypothetical protein